MKVLTQAIAVSVLLNWTAIAAVASDLLLSRPPNTSGSLGGVISDLYYPTPSSPLQQIADRFTLQNAAMITDVGWWGVYYPASTLPTPQQVQFQVRMFTDQPGATAIIPTVSPLYEATLLANVSPFRIVDGYQTYAFSAQLPAAFAATKDAGYWFSVVESDVRTDVSFRWFDSGPQKSPIAFAWRARDTDGWTVLSNVDQFSFSLSGSVVPEPAVPALLALGAVIILFRWQRKSI